MFNHECFLRKDGVWVGHLLSGYSLPMEDPNPGPSRSNNNKQPNVKDVAGNWREAIMVAFKATETAFPGGEIIVHLDHKSEKNRFLHYHLMTSFEIW